MVILGLGSNMGDRLQHLRKAFHAIKALAGVVVKQVSPVYISDALLPDNAPIGWDMPYLNLALRCETQLAPLDLLQQLKNIEWTIGRKPEVRHWGPRIVDIDILAWDDLVIQNETLSVPHESLCKRPFALWPLADVAPFWQFPLEGPFQGKTAIEIADSFGSRFDGQAPFSTRQIYQRIDTPQLVGIVNVTPDSFADGGEFLNPERAVEQACALVNAGAEIIDIGAQSTAPTAKAICAETEWARIEPVLIALKNKLPDFLLHPKLSIDTYYSQVAEKAADLGIDWINDVTGLRDPLMREIVVEANLGCIIMHSLEIPENRHHVLPRTENIIKTVYDWAAKQLDVLHNANIPAHKIIIDPGIGFGKLAEQSLQLIKEADVFASLGASVLIGHSRKSFLSAFTALSARDRDIETNVISLYLANNCSIDYLRLHNVEMCARSFRVAKALTS